VGTRADAQRKASPRRILAGLCVEQVFYRDRERRDVLLAVMDAKDDSICASCEKLAGQFSVYPNAAQRCFGKKSGQHQEREHHSQHQIEQVIARVHCGEAHAEDDRDETPPRTCRSQ